MKNLQQLTQLCLDDNPLETIPIDIIYMKNLKLDLKGLDLRQLELSEQIGTYYLRQRNQVARKIQSSRQWCDLYRTKGVDLCNADLQYLHLCQVDLREAQLSQVRLCSTDLN